MSERLRVVVLGYLVRGPLGGIAWHHLQYVIGLARLGHDVVFLEDSDDYPSCYDPNRNLTGRDPEYGLAFAADTFARLGLADRWGYFDAHRNAWLGPLAARAGAVCRTADVALNVSGVNPLRSWLDRVPVRVLIDTDPAFTQIRHLTDPAARARAAGHTAFFTFGENVGQPGCGIPQDGYPWRPTRQPVVLDAWRPTSGRPAARVSTVMLWESYRAAEYAGTRFGMKSASFGPYLDLPRRSGATFEIAFGGRSEPHDRLTAHGWRVIDSRVPTRDPWTYQEYIQQSKAEFSVAKHGYVVSRSGWFSERSAAYLASGRPVVVQDTGFSRWLQPAGGVFPFSDLEGALAALDALDDSYERHCRDARAVAEHFFASDRVLTDLLASAAGGAEASVSTAGAAPARVSPGRPI